MKLKNILLITCSTLVFLVLSSCNRKPKNINKEVSSDEVEVIESIQELTLEEGNALLKTHCYACHNPESTDHDNMLAPPLAGVKYKYTSLYPNREEFIAKMGDFIQHPSKENAVMKGPVRRFGLMPTSTLKTKKEIYEIVAFIYDNELDVPDWFPAHFEDKHGKSWESAK